MASNQPNRRTRSSSRPRSKKGTYYNNSTAESTETKDPFSTLSCVICTVFFENEAEFEDHKSSPNHMLNYIKYFLDHHKTEFTEDKHGVKVSCLEYRDCVPSLVIPTRPSVPCSITICIENLGETVYFLQFEFLTKIPCYYSVYDKLEVYTGGRMIKMLKESKYEIKINFEPKDVGLYLSPLAFLFRKENNDIFYIVRYIELQCRDSIVESLQEVQPYCPTDVVKSLEPAVTIYPGLRFKRATPNKPKQVEEVELRKITIPQMMQDAILDIQKTFQNGKHRALPLHKEQSLIRDLITLLKKGLSENSHNYYFRTLLNFEEIQMDYDIRKYDMLHQKLARPSRSTNYLTLNVPGLAEQRPSIVLGDRIYVRREDEKNCKRDIEYEGTVFSITDTTVLLGFHSQLMSRYMNGLHFDVRFTYSKYPLFSMHRSLDILTDDQKKYLLFPSWEHAASCPTLFNPTDPLLMYNRKIEDNPEQSTAIKHIVAGSSLPSPYLVHGPPGTGKTVTIVEAIKQIWKSPKFAGKSYILVATPSNSASDLITERLLDHVTPSHLMRLYAYSREWKKVPEKIRKYSCCNYDSQDDCFYVPSREKLMMYRIVISTLINCTRIVSVAVPEGHFTHVFIDEAGHGLEPETLIPVAGLLKCRSPGSQGFGGQLVLAGDPAQLGPVIRCKVADKYNLGRSLLERLMQTSEIYQRKDGKFDPRVLTRLVRNYRSHPAIVKLPSEMFYDDELEVYADKLDRESLCHWDGLTYDDFPVLFHGVYGRDMREQKSPSYFNAEEVAIVIQYVNKLLEARNRGLNITQKQIGIITPYRQQVCKIKNELSKKRYNDISVGSVDEFQGQERKVIIISTVRSNPDLMAYDSQYKLGFVKNPKRFNVSITRAKSLLIIIGNPKLLALDKHWKQLLMYCWKKGSYVGCAYEPPEQEIADVMDRLKSMCLVPSLSEAELAVPISQRAQQEDPQWRDDF